MNDTSTDAASIIAPIWKRKWLILAVGIVVAVGTYLVYKGKAATYSATTQLYLVGNEQPGNAGAIKPVAHTSLVNAVAVINSSLIGENVRKRLRHEGNRAAARAKEKATANASGSFITIKTTGKSEKAVLDLANAYAQAFVKHERTKYTRAVRQQLENATAQLHRLELPPPTTGKGKGAKTANPISSIQEANLETKINNLESQLVSFTGVQQVGKAQATSVLSSPKKNALFGFVLGLVLASIAAYALSRFDRRLRTLGEIESIYKTQILAALPAVKAPARRPDGRRAPAPALVEPLRRLHTTLELGGILERRSDGGGRTILFLSAEAGDGKSTLIANLARVQSEAGSRVAVVEADFRRPAQARLLDANGQYGLADVLGGKVALEEAIQSVATPTHLGVSASSSDDTVGGVSTVVESSGMGSVSVLVGGGAVANPPALLASSAMKDLLGSIAADDFDYVLIDAPPLLEVSDAMPLLPSVDGIVMVARIGHTRDVAVQRLGQLLGRTASAPLLGAVVNCVPRKDIERYGFSWAPTASRPRRKVIGR
jgi:Mrp family chromosome partitioning ATPase/capsular polysaccharide biosynthesis protein